MSASTTEIFLACSVALGAICCTIILPNPDMGPVQAVLFLVGPLGAILFSDALGSFTGPAGRGYINAPTPGCLVKFLGWLLLVLVTIAVIVRCLGMS